MAPTPDLAWMIAAVLIGPAIGSLIGCASVRLPVGAPMGLARSACGGCGRVLGVVDLAPVLSFLALGGRCRTCRATVPRRYLLLELACPALALWAGLTLPGPQALLGAVLAWQLLLLALLDAEHFWLPRALTAALVVSGLAAVLVLAPGEIAHHALGAGAGFLALAGLALAYRALRGREGLGGGDAWMLAGSGAWLGWIALPSVLLMSALAGLSLVLARRLVGRPVAGDEPLPFGVFLALGTWVVWLYGPLGG